VVISIEIRRVFSHLLYKRKISLVKKNDIFK
jgi:hypothetical protein